MTLLPSTALGEKAKGNVRDNLFAQDFSCIYLSLSFFFFFLSQDGKTAEDLASTDQHEHIVSLLGKLKKVKKKKRDIDILNLISNKVCDFFITFLFKWKKKRPELCIT